MTGWRYNYAEGVALFNWFSKGKSKPEVSPGGSVIHRYSNETWSPAQTGSTDASVASQADARHAAYAKIFGEVLQVWADEESRRPRIDVREYKRRAADGSGVYSLVTSGMSDLPMNVPNQLKAPRRVELVLYCAEPQPQYVETLRWIAHFPHDQKTWVGSAHTIPNGDPPAPFWGSAILNTILLMPTIVQRDQKLKDELMIAGEGVDLLWVVPLTQAECELKLAKGLDAILDLFGRNRHPHVFDPNRRSYV